VGKKRRYKGDVDAGAISIKSIVSFYGGEVREGGNRSVRCVLHTDNRKSAVINTDTNLYYCHTCGKGGNAVHIVSILENLEFKNAITRAVEIIARSGDSVRQRSGRGNNKVSRRSWNL
jgi:DNA primase